MRRSARKAAQLSARVVQTKRDVESGASSTAAAATVTIPSAAPRFLLRPGEAAEALGVGRSTIYELVRAGEMRAVHIGRSVRIPTREVEAWVQRQAGDR